jgi:hypothetical protein
MVGGVRGISAKSGLLGKLTQHEVRLALANFPG